MLGSKVNDSVIRKTSFVTTPNLAADWTRAAPVRWEDFKKELRGLPGGGLNIGFEAVDRHVLDGNGQRIAIRCESAFFSVWPRANSQSSGSNARKNADNNREPLSSQSLSDPGATQKP
jgi:hypothetical protein